MNPTPTPAPTPQVPANNNDQNDRVEIRNLLNPIKKRLSKTSTFVEAVDDLMVLARRHFSASTANIFYHAFEIVGNRVSQPLKYKGYNVASGRIVMKFAEERLSSFSPGFKAILATIITRLNAVDKDMEVTPGPPRLYASRSARRYTTRVVPYADMINAREQILGSIGLGVSGGLNMLNQGRFYDPFRANHPTPSPMQTNVIPLLRNVVIKHGRRDAVYWFSVSPQILDKMKMKSATAAAPASALTPTSEPSASSSSSSSYSSILGLPKHLTSNTNNAPNTDTSAVRTVCVFSCASGYGIPGCLRVTVNGNVVLEGSGDERPSGAKFARIDPNFLLVARNNLVLENMKGAGTCLCKFTFKVCTMEVEDVKVYRKLIISGNAATPLSFNKAKARHAHGYLNHGDDAEQAENKSKNKTGAAAAGGGKVEVEEEDDIIMEHIRLLLRDPVSLRVISIPVRGKSCAHSQCFDLDTFLDYGQSVLDRQGKFPKCPVCNVVIPFRQLYVDPYVSDILERVSMGERSGDGKLSIADERALKAAEAKSNLKVLCEQCGGEGEGEGEGGGGCVSCGTVSSVQVQVPETAVAGGVAAPVIRECPVCLAKIESSEGEMEKEKGNSVRLVCRRCGWFSKNDDKEKEKEKEKSSKRKRDQMSDDDEEDEEDEEDYIDEVVIESDGSWHIPDEADYEERKEEENMREERKKRKLEEEKETESKPMQSTSKPNWRSFEISTDVAPHTHRQASDTITATATSTGTAPFSLDSASFPPLPTSASSSSTLARFARPSNTSSGAPHTTSTTTTTITTSRPYMLSMPNARAAVAAYPNPNPNRHPSSARAVAAPVVTDVDAEVIDLTLSDDE